MFVRGNKSEDSLVYLKKKNIWNLSYLQLPRNVFFVELLTNKTNLNLSTICKLALTRS